MTTTPYGDPDPVTQELPPLPTPVVPPMPVAPAAPAPVPHQRAQDRIALLPRARTSGGGRDGAAPLKDTGYRTLQLLLYWAGAVLLPTGLVVIILGWYGAAHTPYQYDQLSYLVSGGLLGLGMTFCGGFLYFGAWLARMTTDQAAASRRLGDALLQLAEITSTAAADAAPQKALIVMTQGGTTMHRRDCQLIAHRDDLIAVGDAAAAQMAPCRICNP